MEGTLIESLFMKRGLSLSIVSLKFNNYIVTEYKFYCSSLEDLEHIASQEVQGMTIGEAKTPARFFINRTFLGHIISTQIST